MDGWWHRWMNAWMDGRMEGGMKGGRMDGRTDGWMENGEGRRSGLDVGMDGWDRGRGDSGTAQTSSSLWWRFLSCRSRSEGGSCSSSLSCLSRRLSSTRGSSALCRGRIPLRGTDRQTSKGPPPPGHPAGDRPVPTPRVPSPLTCCG